MTSEAMNLWQETRDKDALMNAKVYNLLMNTGAKGKDRGGRQAVRGHEDHGRGQGHQADGGAIGSPIGRGLLNFLASSVDSNASSSSTSWATIT